MKTLEKTNKEFTVDRLEHIVDSFSYIYDVYFYGVNDEKTHYPKEYIYALRALTGEVRKHLNGEYSSLKYILEKANVLGDCAREFAIDDRDDDKKKKRDSI